MAGRHHDQNSPLEDFGEQVRELRGGARLSQADLAKKSAISKSHIGKIERGETRCDRRIAEALDDVFGSGDRLQSLWDDLVKDAVAPSWFDWHKIEADPNTVALDTYESLVIPGLLQTEGYASVLFRGDPDKIAFRMGRQQLLNREDPPPPRMSFLIAETALRTQVGDFSVMRYSKRIG